MDGFLDGRGNVDMAQDTAQRPIRVEVVDDAVAAVLRDKTGAERLRIASGLFSSARRMLISHLRSMHPDWCEEQIVREAARRLSGGAF
jgi:hypothetical protein